MMSVDTTVTDAGETGSMDKASLRSYARRRAQVAGCLDELATINAEIGQSARAARIRESRDALLNHRFTLLVLGEFKRGKSTLVNHLVGRDVLPVGAAPTTAVITRVTYGEEPSARLILTDGTERAVELGRLAEEITLAQSDEGSNQQRHGGIARAEVTIPAPICRDGVDVVDSPGLGEHTTRTEVTYEALPAADAVIFVTDAAQLGSEDETFVHQRLLGAEINHVFFVVNKWDRVFNEAEDPEAEIAALRRRAWSLFVPEPKAAFNGQDLRANRIYPLSCRPNLAPEEERAGLDVLYNAFNTDLESFLVNESGRVTLERALARARAAIAETQAGLRARGPALQAGLAEFERRVAAAEGELRGLEGPRQAIRETIARRRQAVRQETRTRAERDLPKVEEQISADFKEYQYRGERQWSQRILDGMQDSFRRDQIRDELRLRAREAAAARLEPWANELNAWLETQVKELLHEVEADAGKIDAAFEKATRILSGVDGNVDSSDRDREELIQRGLAAGVGLLLNPFLIMAGGMHGFRGLGRALVYQFAGVLVLATFGLPIVPALAIGAMIASVQSNEELVDKLKEQALDDVLSQVRAMRTTDIATLETLSIEPINACGTAIEQAIDARIADHREAVEALRAQMSLAREEGGQESAHLDETQTQVAEISARLETIAS
jgi:hypothetical protein